VVRKFDPDALPLIKFCPVCVGEASHIQSVNPAA
jgi:ribosomal protein L33